jgi:hypothetical protein
MDNPGESANKLGAVGWELVTVASHGQGLGAVDHWCFKRALP